MLTSLALVFLVGLALAALCQKLKLPRIIGMLATGILLGPCVLNVLDGSILSISADLRSSRSLLSCSRRDCRSIWATSKRSAVRRS